MRDGLPSVRSLAHMIQLDWETGKHRPGPRYRLLLAAVYALDEHDIFGSAAGPAHAVLERREPASSIVQDNPGFGGELTRLMAVQGIGVRELARRVPCNPGYVSNLANGKKFPSRKIAERCDEVLGANGKLVSQVATPSHRGSGTQKDETSLWRPAGVDINSVFTGDEEERLILAARSPRRHDPGIVDALSTVLSGQRRTEDSIGSASLLEPVMAQLAMVGDLVTEARGDARVKVLDIGSQWAQFSGWLHANTGRIAEANRLYGLALVWATEADRQDMIATALSMQGHAAWLSAKVGPMIGLSQAAQNYNRASPGVRALAVQQEARGIALSGEAEIADVDRKLDEAERLVTQAAENPEGEPPWIYFFSPDYLIMQRGLAYRLLGEYGRAIALIEEGLAAMPPEMRKSDWVASHYLLQLALTYARSGDMVVACRLGNEINDIAWHTRSERLRTDVIRFHDHLNRKYPGHPDIRELSEALR